MEFRYTTELLEYMAEKGRNDIAVEVAATNHSDIEVTEIYVRLVSRKVLQQQGQAVLHTTQSECHRRT